MAKTKRKFPYQPFLWLNLFCIILLLLSYLAPFIPPQVFWFFAILGLAYPLLVLVNLLFILIWSLLLNKNFVYSLLAILLGFNTLIKHFQLENQETNKSVKVFKLLSFNVKNLSNNNIKYADKTIRSTIQNYLAEQNADIICLQEFQTYPSKGINTIKEFQNRLKMPYYFESRYFIKSRFKFVDLMLIYSKYPIIKHQELRHHNKAYAQIIDIAYKKDTIRLFNLHLESNHFEKNEYEIFEPAESFVNDETTNQFSGLFGKIARYSKIRNIQVNHINEYIINSPYPILICGDFNDTPGTYTYNKLLKNHNDAFKEKGKGYGNTYNGKLPPMRIDYILCDKSFQIHRFEVGPIDKSDHFPIISTLSLPQHH